MLLFKGAGVDIDMMDVWEKYSGLVSDIGFDIAVHENVIMRIEFSNGLFGPKIKLGAGWNVENGQKGYLFSLGLDMKQLAHEAVSIPGNHKAMLKVLHMAAGEYNLSEAELNEGLRRAVSKNDIPFRLSRIPLTRGLQVLDENGNPSTLEKLVYFLVQ